MDTSVVIDHLRGDERARAALAAAVEAGERLHASVLTKVEVLAGMRETEERATRRLLGTFGWIEVDDELAEAAGALARNFAHSHPGIDPVDYVIAATVERFAAELWTRNVRHFPMLPGLAAPY